MSFSTVLYQMYLMYRNKDSNIHGYGFIFYFALKRWKCSFSLNYFNKSEKPYVIDLFLKAVLDATPSTLENLYF